MSDYINFYKIYAMVLSLYILNMWDSRTSYDLKQFLKDFESFTYVIGSNGHTSPLSLQCHTNQSFSTVKHTAVKT